jgi:hypothetical protein
MVVKNPPPKEKTDGGALHSFLEERISCCFEYIQRMVLELACPLTEVGISDWERWKSETHSMPSCLAEPPMFHTIRGNWE